MRPAAPTLQGVDEQFNALFRGALLPAIAPPLDPHAGVPAPAAAPESAAGDAP